jgi:hypothetical protein
MRLPRRLLRARREASPDDAGTPGNLDGHRTQMRLYFASLAYTMLQTLRQVGLKGTALAKAQCDTIPLKLLKLAAHVRVTVRKVWISFSQSYAYAQLLTSVHQRLRAPP